MSIINIKEDWEALEAGADTETGMMQRRFTVLFDESDAPQNRPRLAWGATGIPRLYERHPYEATVYAKDKRVTPLGPFLYEVIVYYQTRPTTQQEDGDSGLVHPLNVPAKISWSFAAAAEPIDRDINGKPITNSADESFDPPVTRDVYDLVLHIERNEQNYDPVHASEFIGAINSGSFFGFDAGLVKCVRFDSDRARFGDDFYYQVAYEFQVRFAKISGVNYGWKLRVLDQGFREKTGTDTNGKPTYAIFKDDDGNPLSQPVLLNGSGGKKTVTDPAEFLVFDVDRSVSFDALNLP